MGLNSFKDFLDEDMGEESWNNLLGGLLELSVVYGPELLNEIHKRNIFEFKEPSFIAIQEKLDGVNKTREIDWVIEDQEKDLIVGYENKLHASLSSNQLKEEFETLTEYSNKEKYLMVITSDFDKPGIVKKLQNRHTEMNLRWMNWWHFSTSLKKVNNLPKEQKPILKLIKEALKTKNMYNKFEGLPEKAGGDWETNWRKISQKQDQIFKNLIPALNIYLENQPLKPQTDGRKNVKCYDNRKVKLLEERDWQYLIPRWYMIPYEIENEEYNSNKKRGYPFIGLLHDFWSTNIWVVHHLRLSKYEAPKTKIKENIKIISEIMEKNNLEMYFGHNQWRIAKKINSEELKSIDKSKLGDGDFKRAMMGKKIDAGRKQNPDKVIETIGENIKKLYTITWKNKNNREIFYLD